MPYMTNGKRDYKKQYEKYDGKEVTKKRRAQRNKAHRMVEKELGHKTSKDVGHKKAMSRGGKTTLGNIFLQDPGENKSFARNKDGSMKSETSKRESKKRK